MMICLVLVVVLYKVYNNLCNEMLVLKQVTS